LKRDINTLQENPNNPRTISRDKFDKLVTSLREFPEMLEARPIVINPDGMVLGGNMRLKAAREVGLKEVHVYEATWEEAKQKEFIIKDNVSFGEHDWDILANEWDAVQLDDWGLDVWQEVEEKEGLTDPDEVPEVPADPVTQLGDLWILGEHRLLCGDSTKAEDVERLMDGNKADMVFTDPPYGMDLDTDYTKMPNGKRHDRVIGDNTQFDASFVLRAFAYCDEIFLWGADYYVETLGRNYPDLGSWIVWDKYSDQDRKGLLDGRFGSAFETCWSKTAHKREIARVLVRTNYTSKGDETRVHPTQKPVELAEWFFERWGKGRTNIVDLFLGSGSTLIAAEKTGRKCYGMELDPKYCDVIVKRWEDFTGQKASKANA